MEIKTHINVSTLLALLLMLVSASCIAAAVVPAPIAIPLETPPPPGDVPEVSDMNITKLQISPRHTGLDLMPGESDEITVTVKNPNNETVSVDPMIKDQPYSDYVLDKEWITITPASAELEADGGEEEFTISVAIPDDAERGNYNTQIAFTDDVMPTPYPAPYPMYLNALNLHISVWKPPVMQIQPRHIYDRVESGKEYDYTINLKNTGDEDIEIDPELKPERWHHNEMGGQAFEDDAITITAPPVVPANGTATVNVHLEVPLGAKGEYYSGLDLGIDDSSSGGWYGGSEMVQLNFKVWTQPTEPYTKEFATETAAPITIEIESNQYRYDMCGGGSSESGDDETPSFDVTLQGPAGDQVTLTRTTVKHYGSVNLGGSDCAPPWELESTGMYNEGRASYVALYTANGDVGNWELGILPHYVEAFDYTIKIGDSET
ncbi:MAG: hypothetical protein EF813_04530 [Methanosarcinales archaeon]|nr:MAG: hypothetical protein EF813_04530 [Methanosarcinales archaeon]